ncbi:MAG: ATP-binding protein [Bifidobacterium sp.]|uniref:AAA family ATPase n=1 Tax=Bifidobacterium sp. TaxID=41200 RepID=UPI003EFE9D19
MFIGRTRQLQALNRMRDTDSFQMMVMLGWRGVGKTALLDKFSHDKHALYFTARQQATANNLRDFSAAVFAFFNLPNSTPSFASWQNALSFIAQRISNRDERFLLIFDEFPYAAMADTSHYYALFVKTDELAQQAREMKDSGLFTVVSARDMLER